MELNINQDSEISCIEKLDKDLEHLINKYEQGISFKDLRNTTMERNPATRKHYHQYLQMLKDAKEIEIIRENKVYNGIKYRDDDIIKKSSQMLLFNMRN